MSSTDIRSPRNPWLWCMPQSYDCRHTYPSEQIAQFFLQAPFTSVILSFFNNGSSASVRELPTKLSPYPPFHISQGMFYILRNVILQLTAQQ